MVYVILLYALFASLFAFSKATLDHCEPFFLVGSRMLLAGVLLLGHQFFFNRNVFKKLNRRAFLDFSLLGFIAIYLTNISEIWGIQHTSSAKACFIYSISPFLSGIFSYFIFREVLSKRKWIGIVLGFLGLIPLQMHSLSHSTADNFSSLLGEFAVFIAGVSSVYGWILLKQIITRHKQSLILANGFAMLIGGTLATLHSYFSGESWSPIPVTNFEEYLVNTVIMCVTSNIICYNLYGHLLKRYTATFMSFAGLITPLFASLFGWYFLNEEMTWHFVFSFLLFSIGLSLFHKDELREQGLVQHTS